MRIPFWNQDQALFTAVRNLLSGSMIRSMYRFDRVFGFKLKAPLTEAMPIAPMN